MFFNKTRQLLKDKIHAYLEQVDTCLDNFRRSMDVFLTTDDARGTEFMALVQETHHSESLADDRRNEFEIMLYKGRRLLPGSRSDIFAVLEAFDRLPNKAETILFIIQCQHLRFPESLKAQTRELLDLNLKAAEEARKAFINFFDHPVESEIQKDVKEIDRLESLSDRGERELISRLFDMPDIETGNKLMIKELILNIGSLSDRAENLGTIIMVNTVKRLI